MDSGGERWLIRDDPREQWSFSPILLALPLEAGDGPPAWEGSITEAVRKAEYAFSSAGDGAWSAPNRAHDLRVRLDGGGLLLTSRVHGDDPSGGGWRMTIGLAGVGRGHDLRSSRPAAPVTASGSRLEIHRGEVTEWYLNDERGLEQGFTIATPPVGRANGRALVVEMVLDTDLLGFLAPDGSALVFRRGDGEAVLRYGELVVSDAAGDPVASLLEAVGRRLRILVEDEDAAYPLIVDPLLTTAGWTGEGNQAGALFGFSVATAGDVNGDGFSDLIVGAEDWDNGATGSVGKAFVFHGSSAGLAATAAWTSRGPDQGGAHFGHSVAPAGDVNGDGYDDVIVGAPDYDGGSTDEGAAYVYLGSATGLGASHAWHAEGEQAGAQLGKAVGTAGSVNGDKFADVIVGAWSYDDGEADEGAAFVWLGGAGGLGDDGVPRNADWSAEADQTGAALGVSVGTAGDVDADGYDDVIVGAYLYDNGQPDEGAAFVWRGGPTGLGAAGTPANADWTGQGNQAVAEYGLSAATAGDVDGDGYADLIIGAPLYDNGETNEGRVFVHLGSAIGPSLLVDWVAELDQANAFFGRSVATAGDVNGDGYADIVAGAYLYDLGGTDRGAALAWFGGSSWAIEPDGTYFNADWSRTGDQDLAEYGFSVAAAGDVDGDGFGDVVVGARKYDGGETNEGRAYVYTGSAEAPSAFANQGLGEGQGGARFGQSIGAAGDVNGDGYGDVIVGAPDFDGGSVDEGKVFVYLGGDLGLGVPWAWSAESNQAGARFGISVSGAGDVNGDGPTRGLRSPPHARSTYRSRLPGGRSSAARRISLSRANRSGVSSPGPFIVVSSARATLKAALSPTTPPGMLRE